MMTRQKPITGQWRRRVVVLMLAYTTLVSGQTIRRRSLVSTFHGSSNRYHVTRQEQQTNKNKVNNTDKKRDKKTTTTDSKSVADDVQIAAVANNNSTAVNNTTTDTNLTKVNITISQILPSLTPSTAPTVAVAKPLVRITTRPSSEPTVVPITVVPDVIKASVTTTPTTLAPTTQSPTTLAPVTLAPTTLEPTTLAPSTLAPTTLPPTTGSPTLTPSTAASVSPSNIVVTAILIRNDTNANDTNASIAQLSLAFDDTITTEPIILLVSDTPSNVPTNAPIVPITMAPTTAAPTTALPTTFAPTTAAPSSSSTPLTTLVDDTARSSYNLPNISTYQPVPQTSSSLDDIDVISFLTDDRDNDPVTIPLRLAIKFADDNNNTVANNATVQQLVVQVASDFICSITDYDIDLVQYTFSDSMGNYENACLNFRRLQRATNESTATWSSTGSSDETINDGTVLYHEPSLLVDNVLHSELSVSMWTLYFRVFRVGPTFIQSAMDNNFTMTDLSLARFSIDMLHEQLQADLDNSLSEGDFNDRLRDNLDSPNVQSSPVGMIEMRFGGDQSTSAVIRGSDFTPEQWGLLRIAGVVIILMTIALYILIMRKSKQYRKQKDERAAKDKPVSHPGRDLEEFMQSQAFNNDDEDVHVPLPAALHTPSKSSPSGDNSSKRSVHSALSYKSGSSGPYRPETALLVPKSPSQATRNNNSNLIRKDSSSSSSSSSSSEDEDEKPVPKKNNKNRDASAPTKKPENAQSNADKKTNTHHQTKPATQANKPETHRVIRRPPGSSSSSSSSSSSNSSSSSSSS